MVVVVLGVVVVVVVSFLGGWGKLWWGWGRVGVAKDMVRIWRAGLGRRNDLGVT